jgi:hypothetical protein
VAVTVRGTVVPLLVSSRIRAALLVRAWLMTRSITRVYARNQKDEHQRYKSIYDANAEEFAMVEQMQRYVRCFPDS